MNGVSRALVSAVLGAAAVVFAPAVASAQDWRGWSFYWENDTWAPSRLGSDDAYTNGLRLVMGRHPQSNLWPSDMLERWFPAQAVEPGGRNYRVTSALVLGQNFFTPRTVTDYVPDPSDRPYAGLSYVGWRYDVTSDLELDGDRIRRSQHQLQHSFELDVGVLGQGAGARKFQAGVHSVITTHRIPKGWSHQIRNTPAVTLSYMARSRWALSVVDATLHGGGLVGSTQIYPMAGLTVRLGKGMSGLPSLLVRPTAVDDPTRHPVEVGVAAGVEGRYMAYNAFVEGSAVSVANPGIDPVRWVGHYSAGFFVRVLSARLDYTLVRRSPEVAEVGPSERAPDYFGSVVLSFEPGSGTLRSQRLDDFFKIHLPKAFEGFYVEGGFGYELTAGESGIATSHVMHTAIGRRLWRDFDIGYEHSGVGREFGPPLVGETDHRDRMLRTSAFTLRYRPFGGRFDKFDFHVRGGASLGVLSGGKNEVELSPTATGPRVCPVGFTLDGPSPPENKGYCGQTESGGTYLFGAGLSWRPIGTELGLNLDIVWADVGAGTASHFAGWSLGMRWTPSES